MDSTPLHRGSVYSGVGAGIAMRAGNEGILGRKRGLSALALHLPLGLVDQHLDRHGLGTAAAAGTAHRSGTEVIEADRDAHMGFGRADAVGRIERDPADRWYEGVGPGVA